MRLLVVTREYPPYVLGGISYHLKNLYKNISELGHEITIISGKSGSATTTSDIEIKNDIEIQWVPYPTIQAHHLQFPILARYAISKLDISEFDAILTHTEIPFDIDIPVINKKHDCKPVSAEYSRSRPLCMRTINKFINPTRKYVNRRSLATSDHVIFNSHLTKTKWREHYSLETSSSVIHNGVDLSIFYPREPTSTDEYLLFVGDSERKGISKILSFAPHAPYPVYLVGPSNVNAQNAFGLGRVSQHELAKYYSDAVATLHPAKFEAFGNVILESLACGTPVVVSEQCGAAEIIDDSVGAVTDDLGQGLLEIREVNSSNCTRVAQQYTWDKVAKRTVDIINSNI